MTDESFKNIFFVTSIWYTGINIKYQRIEVVDLIYGKWYISYGCFILNAYKDMFRQGQASRILVSVISLIVYFFELHSIWRYIASVVCIVQDAILACFSILIGYLKEWVAFLRIDSARFNTATIYVVHGFGLLYRKLPFTKPVYICSNNGLRLQSVFLCTLQYAIHDVFRKDG